jgi:hypothetical protein
MGVIKNVLIGLDQTFNCLIKLSDGWGCPDEMLSARAWRLRVEHPRLRVFIDGMFFWDVDHCKECYEIEMHKEQFPNTYVKHHKYKSKKEIKQEMIDAGKKDGTT